MATKEEIKLQKESIRLQKESNQLQRDRIGMDAQQKANQDDFANALASSVKNIANQNVEKKELLSISSRLNKLTSEEYTLTGEELKSKKFGNDLAKKQLQNKKDILNLQRLSTQITGLDEKAQENLNQLIAGRLKTAEDLTKEYGKQQAILEKVQKNPVVKVLSSADGILKKLGLDKLAPIFGDAADAAKDAITENELNKDGKGQRVQDQLGLLSPEDEAKLQDKSGAGIDSDFLDKIKGQGFDTSIMGGKTGKGAADAISGAGGLGKSIGGALKPLSAFSAAFKKMMKSGPLAILTAIMNVDKAVSETAKSMNITYNEATALKRQLSSVANTSGDLFVNSKNTLKTFVSLNEVLGTTSKTLTAQNAGLASSLAMLEARAGFTQEELKGIASLTLSTGENAETITGEFMASAKAASVQNGVMLNTKTLTKELSSLSAATTLSLSKNPKLLGEALSVTKSLGMEMAQLDGIASSMLDFESSIANELEAELLLGRNINLEKARQAALNNDLATLATEIAEQAGTAAEFGEMNRLQQEAIAKAVGMNREELAQTLYVQEQLSGLTGEEAAKEEEILNNRIATVGLAQAQKEMATEGIEGLKAQVGMADRLTATMDKLGDLLVGLVEPMMPLIDVFVSLLSIVGGIMKLLDPLIQFVGTGFSFLADLTNLDGDFSLTNASVRATEDSAQANYGASMDYFGELDDDGNRTRMAKGGIVRRKTRAIVGEAGPEAVTPLPPSGIKVDNTGIESLLKDISNGLSRQKPISAYQISRS